MGRHSHEPIYQGRDIHRRNDDFQSLYSSQRPPNHQSYLPLTLSPGKPRERDIRFYKKPRGERWGPYRDRRSQGPTSNFSYSQYVGIIVFKEEGPPEVENMKSMGIFNLSKVDLIPNKLETLNKELRFFLKMKLNMCQSFFISLSLLGKSP